MKHLLLTTLTLLPLAALGAPALAAVPVVPGDDIIEAEEKEAEQFTDKRAEVANLIDRLEDHLKARGDEDDEAMGVIDELVIEFEQSGPKDREDIAEVIGECLEVKREELAEDVPDQKLQTYAARAMGSLKHWGGAELLKLVDHKELEGKVNAQREAILALGRSRHPKGVKVLLGLLDHAVYAIEGAAAQALDGYKDADQKIRKEIVADLLKKIVPLYDRIENEGDYSGGAGGYGGGGNQENEEIAKEYRALAAPTMSTLRALTGHTEEDFRLWEAWWNENKREDWDPDEED